MNSRKQAWAAITIILLCAAFFRLYRLHTMPWGLSQDETNNASISLSLLKESNQVPFLRGGFGHEPLFHYLQFITLRLFGDNVVGIRMPAVASGMLLVAASYTLIRHLFSPVAAFVTMGSIAVSWWSIIFSRIGIRAITFPLFLTLAILLLWKGLRSQHHIFIILAGLLLGLCFYTYTASRILPLLGAAWLAYAIIFQPQGLRRHWRALLGAGLITTILVTPLVIYLNMHPELQERVEQLQDPLVEIRQGNPRPITRAALATLTMFSRSGESRWTYGIPGRPILGLFTGLLFYLGIIRCGIQIRRPECGILGLWLFVGLAPSMITPDSPSSIRAIGALPAAFGLVGSGADWIWNWTHKYKYPLRAIFSLGLIIIGVSHSIWTYKDGFIKWATHEKTYWLYKSHFADIATFLDNQSTPQPTVVIEPWITPLDINGVRRNLIHEKRQPRWSRGGLAFIWPSQTASFTLALPIYSTSNNMMWNRFTNDPPVVAVSTFKMPDGRPGVTFYNIASQPILSDTLETASQSPVMLPQNEQRFHLPANFGNQLDFLGYQIVSVEPSQEARIITFWRAIHDSPQALHLFIHLLNTNGNLVTQHDGFDAWIESLHKGDVVAQLHTLPLKSVPSGHYRLQVGAYTLPDQVRLPVLNKGTRVADRLWLATVEIES
jgi:hypothetical protein